MDDIFQNNQSDVCCAKCKFFDKRTSFCRANPPVVSSTNVNNRIIYSTNFPKIQMPNLDFCHLIEKIDDMCPEEIDDEEVQN